MPRLKLTQLIKNNPGIDMVFGGDSYSLTKKRRIVGNTLVSYAGVKGQYVTCVEWNLENEIDEYLNYSTTKLELWMKEKPEITKALRDKYNEYSSSIKFQSFVFPVKIVIVTDS